MKRRHMLGLLALALSAPSRAVPGGLVDHRGKPFRLAGSWTLLTFGFTQCTTTCPALLATAARALDHAPASTRVVFVTLDPLADDAHALAAYLRRFDTRIVGVTGDPGAVHTLATQLRVGMRGAGPAIEHSAVWYLIDPRANVRRVLPSQASARELALARVQTP